MDENTTLGDLLELQLHRVEEEVKNIVDKAVKEMGIEKVQEGDWKHFWETLWDISGHNKMLCVQILGEIKQTWSMMSLSYETHTSTGTPLLKADENLIETLEDNFLYQSAGFSSSKQFCIINVHFVQASLVLLRSDPFILVMISLN